MGTEIDYKNSFPGYYSMGNANEDSINSNWHAFNTLTNNHYYDGYTSRTVTDAYSGQDKDELKQKMLQHEEIFKNQVYELHRLYRRQHDMMEEVKRKDFHKYHISIDTSSSSSLMASQKPYEDANMWQKTASIPSVFSNSPISCSKQNGSKGYEAMDCRPSKVRKKLFDLQLPAYEYIEPEEAVENIVDKQNSGKKDGYKTTVSDQNFNRSNRLMDLNEPVDSQDVDFLDPAAKTANGRSNMNQCFETSKLHTHSNTMHHLDGKEVQHRGFYLEISSKIQDHSHFKQTPYSFNSMGNSWGPSKDSPTHKAYPSFHKSHEVMRDKWHSHGNGFTNGASSGSKELYSAVNSVGFNYQNGYKLEKIFKGSESVDLTGATKDMDLNSVKKNSIEDDNSINCEQTVLPWLKAKTVLCKNGDNSGDVNKKNDNLSGGLTRASVEHREIDINVTWDDDDDMDKQIDVKKDAEIKNQFDLNSCVTEDDDLLVTESVKSSNKKSMEIDLEAPAVSEIDEEDEVKETVLKTNRPERNELETVAAEAIVAISSQQNHIGPGPKVAHENNPLLWFVDVINRCERNITREIDEYEMLTLGLKETEEKDYMPTPLVPEFQEESDEVGPDLTNCRPRRGQARRGRPCRDFQRDILPGMNCLSRHEITEDIQIFGGLMKATGYSWNLGLTRKNGKRNGARGRRKVKAVETPAAASVSPPTPLKLSSPRSKQVEGLGLDERRLTGWGKTTRRPPRQRYVSNSNIVAVQLT